MTSIKDIIRSNSPILTGQIILKLRNAGWTQSDDALRQQISRIKDDNIFRLQGYFAHRQTLFYIKDDYNSDGFSEGLREAIKSDAKQYHYLLTALEFHRGLLPFEQLAAYGVNPVSRIKGHVSYGSAIEKLESLELVYANAEEVSLNEKRSNIKPNPRLGIAIQLVKDTLLLQYNDWARKLAFTSYDASSFYSPFGNFCFAFVAPSYISTLTKWKEGKLLPGYIVADILVNNNITVDHVEFFIKKVNILKAQKNTPNFLPFLLVDSVQPDALTSLKSNGIIVGFVNQLFGDEYSSLMKSLINTVVNAGAILKTNPEQFVDLIKKLKALVSGKTNNLRGDLFELAVGYYHSKMGCGTLDIGKLISNENLQREMDVYAVYGNKVVVAECKGHNYPVTKAEIETWRNEKVEVIRNWILNQPSLNDKEIHFQYWSTGGYNEDSKSLIESMELTKKYKVEFYDPVKIMQTSGLAKSKKFTEIMQDYFLKQS